MGNRKADIFDTFGDSAQTEFFELVVGYLAGKKKRDNNYLMTHLRKSIVEVIDENSDFVNVVNFKNLPSQRRQELVTIAITRLLNRLELPIAENLEQIQQIYVQWKNRHNRL